MKINDIAKEIAKREGKKSQARIGDIKEILGIIADMAWENSIIIHNIIQLGMQRYTKINAKKRVKK